MPTLATLSGLEILDSRGRPTVRAVCMLRSGASAAASVPSGASTGSAEALELRDGDPRRYRGKGCLTAAAHLADPISAALAGQEFDSQAAFDAALLALDGTEDKHRLGANALLAASLAFARACALERGQPLHTAFAGMLPAGADGFALPRPMINLFSGGKHAGGQVAIQDVLIVPLADTMPDVLAQAAEVYQCAAELIAERFAMRLLRADEGGLAPPVASAEALLSLAVEAVERAGAAPGRDIALAVDVASTHFHAGGLYHLDGARLTSEAMAALLVRWAQQYALVSIEDGLAEEDWAGWQALRAQLPAGVLALGDDLLCTNPRRIRQALALQAADALLLKVNQIGTLTEAAESARLAREAGWRVVVSARSGETEDDWLADLAVGWRGDYIKIGSITQSERLAKYNRLLEIAAETGWPLRRIGQG
jgi:enolase